MDKLLEESTGSSPMRDTYSRRDFLKMSGKLAASTAAAVSIAGLTWQSSSGESEQEDEDGTLIEAVSESKEVLAAEFETLRVNSASVGIDIENSFGGEVEIADFSKFFTSLDYWGGIRHLVEDEAAENFAYPIPWYVWAMFHTSLKLGKIYPHTIDDSISPIPDFTLRGEVCSYAWNENLGYFDLNRKYSRFYPSESIVSASASIDFMNNLEDPYSRKLLPYVRAAFKKGHAQLVALDGIFPKTGKFTVPYGPRRVLENISIAHPLEHAGWTASALSQILPESNPIQMVPGALKSYLSEKALKLENIKPGKNLPPDIIYCPIDISSEEFNKIKVIISEYDLDKLGVIIIGTCENLSAENLVRETLIEEPLQKGVLVVTTVINGEVHDKTSGILRSEYANGKLFGMPESVPVVSSIPVARKLENGAMEIDFEYNADNYFRVGGTSYSALQFSTFVCTVVSIMSKNKESLTLSNIEKTLNYLCDTLIINEDYGAGLRKYEIQVPNINRFKYYSGQGNIVLPYIKNERLTNSVKFKAPTLDKLYTSRLAV